MWRAKLQQQTTWRRRKHALVYSTNTNTKTKTNTFKDTTWKRKRRMLRVRRQRRKLERAESTQGWEMSFYLQEAKLACQILRIWS